MSQLWVCCVQVISSNVWVVFPVLDLSPNDRREAIPTWTLLLPGDGVLSSPGLKGRKTTAGALVSGALSRMGGNVYQ